MIELWPFQQTLIDRLRGSMLSGSKAPLLVSPTGSGKCLGRGTPVMKYSGRIDPVEKIKVGDELMGPDGQPRRVVSLARGREEMYRVTPMKGDSYVVNESHILSLKMTPNNQIGYADGEVVNISVKEYLKQTKTFRWCAKGWKAAVDFAPTNEALRIPPYILGVWLGDGSSKGFSITTGDPEIALEFSGYCAALGMRLRVEPNSENSVNMYIVGEGKRWQVGRNGGPMNNTLRSYGILHNKRIPHRYKTGSKEERLEVLAGILDTDGHCTGSGYDLTLKSEKLLDDVIFVARSLGFSAYKAPCQKTCYNSGVVGAYWRCHINGPVETVPCRIERKKAKPRTINKNPLVTGIRSVEPIGVDDYFGFELAGTDRLFLLGDFTVTHNTVMFAYLTGKLSASRKRTVILAHRKELLGQISRTLNEFTVGHGIIQPGDPYNSLPLTHVASVFSAVRKLDYLKPPDFVIIDEAHHAIPGSTWNKTLDHWREANPKLRIIGVTATPERLSGEGLGDTFDTMIEGPTVAELIRDGFLSPYRMFAPANPIDLSGLHRRAGDYVKAEAAELMDKPKITGNAIEHYRQHLNGAPAVAFCVSVEHAHHVAEQFRAQGWKAVAIDGKLKDKERKERTDDFAAGRLNVMTSCDLISEGYDVPGMMGCINLRPTESLAMCLQQWGRALRYQPGKTAVILDHVGNSARHGLPDQDRVWSLDGVAANKRGKRDPDDIAIRQCAKCGAVNPASARTCSECKSVFEIKARKIEEVAGKLEEITEQRKREFMQTQLATNQFNALVKLGKMRGYKNPEGWARHVQEATTDKRLRKQVLKEMRG